MNLNVIVNKLLNMNPDPIPKFVLLKEFKGCSPDSMEYQNAYDRVCGHHFVKKIEESQNDKGFWHPFHGDTEGNIRLLLSYGLEKDHPCLKKVTKHIIRLMNKEEDYDSYEKQDNPRMWPEIFMPLVLAAMLSLIDYDNEKLVEHRKRWASFTELSMKKVDYTGTYRKKDFQVFNRSNPQKLGYDYEADKKNQNEHFGFKTKCIMPPFNYYCLLLMAPFAGKQHLSDNTSQALVDYCMNEADGIYYIHGDCPGRKYQLLEQNRESNYFCHWIRALSIISQFNGWEKYEKTYSDWILGQRNQDGLWAYPRKHRLFALSDSWRGNKRAIDSSIFVLRLLMGKRAF